MNKLLFFFFLLFGLTAFTQTDSSFTYRKARIYNLPCMPCPTDSLNIDPKQGISPYQFKDKDKPIKVDSATYYYFLLQKAKREEEEQQPNLP